MIGHLRGVALAFGLAICGAIIALPPCAEGGCTRSSDAWAVQTSLRQAMRCEFKLLRSGPDAGCTIAPGPSCAGTLVVDAAHLAYGVGPLSAIDERALRDQLKCQDRIGKAVSYYVGTKLRYLIRGRTAAEAESRASKYLDKMPESCAVPVAPDTGSGLTLPRVGPQCAAALGPPTGVVDTAALRNCLRQLGEVWVDRWGPAPRPLRPNILFILSDDQRWDTTDDTHSPVPGQAVMPRLRRELGGSGVEFVNAFMSTPLCCPSRSSILRGQYAHTTGVYTNSGVKGGADDFVDTVTMGTILQSAGYRTGFYGKYLNGYPDLWTAPQPPYVPPGWTVWGAFRNPKYFDYTLIENGVGVRYGSAEGDYSTDVLREKAKTFISDSVALGVPFFLHLSLKAPHGPFTPAPRHNGMFAGLTPWRPASYNEPDVSDKPAWVRNTAPLTPAEQADLDDTRIKQLEMLQAVDEAIGGSTAYGITGIMEHLRNLGIADDTIVIYFSDNGWHWGEHRYRAKNKPYEESIRAPMFVRYPKLAPLPRVEDKLALNIDFCPTLAELALRPTDPVPPIVFDGVSLVRVLDGTAAAWRSDFLTEGWPTTHVWASVRETDWKYTELPTAPGDPMTGFQFELYDLVNDPLELENLASNPAYATRMMAMAARLRALRPLWPLDADPLFEDEAE
jgi:arylsulfatase A-like enzyme